MIVVLDASAAIEIALNKSSAPFFKKTLLQSEVVLAPDTYPSEITNVFWKYGNFSGLSPELCEKGITYCIDLIDDYIPTVDLCKEVLAESLRTGHSAYDLFYLVVARRNSAGILSMDKKMMTIARALKVTVLRP
jgi:predicted nucleic acid-binding protein